MAKKTSDDPPQIPPIHAGTPQPPTAPDPAGVPPHQQCPLCFRGRGGIGIAYSTQRTRRYYKCGTCGHSWTAVITPAQVQRIDSRPPPDVETR